MWFFGHIMGVTSTDIKVYRGTGYPTRRSKMDPTVTLTQPRIPLATEDYALTSIRPPLIVIEHMEEKVTRWLIIEYVEAFKRALEKGLYTLITGASTQLSAVLTSLGVPNTPLHSWELGCPQPSIVLDMRAEKVLEPYEARGSHCILVGGIMGDHPPRGRGYLLLHNHPGYTMRSLGDEQMSVHTAVYVASLIASGTGLEDIHLVYPARLFLNTPFGDIEVELPYAYVKDSSGEPLVPEELKELLRRGIMWDEI